MPAVTTDAVVKMGINGDVSTFSLSAPAGLGQSINYLIEAAFQEVDEIPVVLPYYNAANPAQSFSGPANSGSAQNTIRAQRVQIQLKPGPTWKYWQSNHSCGRHWLGWVVSNYYRIWSNAGYSCKYFHYPDCAVPNLEAAVPRPGFGSGIQSFLGSGTFSVPVGVTQVEVEVWGGGSESYASLPGLASGGGSGGGYAKKLVTNLVPGQPIAVTVGVGGGGGTSAGSAAQAGGASAFGQFVSASGGSLNPLASVSAPQMSYTGRRRIGR